MTEALLPEKLRRMCELVVREQERTWLEHVDELGHHLIDTLRGDVPPDLELVERLSSCARLLDCCEAVERYALGSGADPIESAVAFDAARHADDLDEFMDDLLEGAPRRGYLYIAWTARPEEYWYVGQASREDRLRRHRQHGNLAHALRDAARLTVIFPTAEAKLTDLEAALLWILRDQDFSPVHNATHRPGTPRMSWRSRLDRMSRTLSQFAKRIG